METRIFEGPCTCLHPADMHGEQGCRGRVIRMHVQGGEDNSGCPCTGHWVQPPESAGSHSQPDYGRIAYEAYFASCGGLSIRGEPLPGWDGQDEAIRRHWQAAGRAVEQAVRAAVIR